MTAHARAAAARREGVRAGDRVAMTLTNDAASLESLRVVESLAYAASTANSNCPDMGASAGTRSSSARRKSPTVAPLASSSSSRSLPASCRG